MDKNKFTLTQVTVDDFRTLEKLELNLYDDINIFIGTNGSGKTNILTSIYNLLTFDLKSSGNMSGELTFNNYEGREISLKIQNDKSEFKNNNKTTITTDNLSLHIKTDKLEFKKIDDLDEFRRIRNKHDLLYTPIFIRHNIPKHYVTIDRPFQFSYNSDNLSSLIDVITATAHPLFIRNLFIELYVKCQENKDQDKNPENIKHFIKDIFNNFISFNDELSEFSSIKDVRLSDSLSVEFNEIDNKFYIKNLIFEFKVNSKWQSFKNLSDGTKRIFYIVSEVAYYSGYVPENNGFSFGTNTYGKIILLEEPELGLHPHIFDKILNYISDSCKEYQFLISTHSPQTLDILKAKDLEKINRVSLNNNYTHIERLNNDEIDKAKLYMEDQYLSDYWRFSDLEKS